MEKVGVTVYCLVYNHEKYIRKCLDSLVGQKTNFTFRVIVHDDASTDHSKQIIEEYESKYPSIIFPIYQSENQHSKKTGIVKTFIEPNVNSKYVAVCEGDDYWLSEKKLQMQFEAMEAHPECGICLHRTMEVSEDEHPTGKEYPEQVYPTGVISSDELFATFLPRFYQTTSFFFREPLWHSYIQNPPEYRKHIDIGDAAMLLYFGSNSGIYQINEVLSCYRRGAPTSWSAKQLSNAEKRSKHFDSMVRGYKCFDTMTDRKYHHIFSDIISKSLYAKCALIGDFSDFRDKSNSEYIRILPFIKRMTIYIGTAFPQIVKKIYARHTQSKNTTEKNKWYNKV